MNEQRTVPGSRFFPYVAGKTNGAERKILIMMQHLHQVEVDSIEDSDFVLLFCPVPSRVETDINEALSKVQTDKPIILVVMHHTFDPERIIAESRRQVHNLTVILTVDVLFHEGILLNCNRNDISYFEIKKILVITVGETTWRVYWVRKAMCIGLGTLAVAILIGVIIAVVCSKK